MSLIGKHCCEHSRDRSTGKRLKTAGWIVPGVILAILPKCPFCIVAYVGLATGIGLSIPAASGIRSAIIILCIAVLAYGVAIFISRTVRKSNKYSLL